MRWLVAGAEELAPTDDVERSARRLSEFGASTGGPGRSLDRPVARDRTSELERTADLARRFAGRLADRRTGPAHFTGSAVVVDAGRRRALVLMHTKLRRWLQPGGHADGDHELAGVALREATEETGIDGLAVLVPAIDLDIHLVDHGDELGVHEHVDLQFLVAAPPGAVERGNHESTDLRWVTPDELAQLVDDDALVDLVRTGLSVARLAPPPPSGWLS